MSINPYIRKAARVARILVSVFREVPRYVYLLTSDSGILRCGHRWTRWPTRQRFRLRTIQQTVYVS